MNKLVNGRKIVTVVRDKEVGSTPEAESQSGSLPSTICTQNQNSK